MESPTRDTRSLGDLLRELSTESTRLFRQEVSLAKAEMKENAIRIAKDAALIGAGALVALVGALALLYALIRGVMALLSLVMDPTIAMWLAPLLVGLVIAGVGYFLIQYGLSRLRGEHFKPEKTAESLQETKQWLQHRLT